MDVYRIGYQYPVQAVALQRRHGTRVARPRVDPGSAHPVGGVSGSIMKVDKLTSSLVMQCCEFLLVIFRVTVPVDA